MTRRDWHEDFIDKMTAEDASKWKALREDFQKSIYEFQNQINNLDGFKEKLLKRYNKKFKEIGWYLSVDKHFTHVKILPNTQSVRVLYEEINVDNI